MRFYIAYSRPELYFQDVENIEKTVAGVPGHFLPSKKKTLPEMPQVGTHRLDIRNTFPTITNVFW